MIYVFLHQKDDVYTLKMFNSNTDLEEVNDYIRTNYNKRYIKFDTGIKPLRFLESVEEGIVFLNDKEK